MPILIRPVREQLEHDRLIRLLQAKMKRKFEVLANPGDEQNGSVKAGTAVLFPDLVLNTPTAPRRLMGVVEVETGESVNNLEAMAQWAHFARVRGGLQLYIPVGSLDIARRLCQDHQIVLAELWSYLWLGDQARFTLVERHTPPEPAPPARAEKPERTVEKRTRPAAKAAKPVRVAKEAKRPAATKPTRTAAGRTKASAARRTGATVRGTGAAARKTPGVGRSRKAATSKRR